MMLWWFNVWNFCALWSINMLQNVIFFKHWLNFIETLLNFNEIYLNFMFLMNVLKTALYSLGHTIITSLEFILPHEIYKHWNK